MLTRHFLCGRSMTIFEIAACLRPPIRTSRIFMSSCSSLPYSVLLENQRLSQVRLTPRRRPIGLIFCPIAASSGRLRFGRDFPHHDRDVGERLLDAAGSSARAGAETLHNHVLADEGLRDDEIVDVELVVVLGVGDGALKRLLHLD